MTSPNSLTRRVVDALSRAFGVCQHRSPSWPIENVGRHNLASGHGRQVCTDCGRFRFYVIGVGHTSRWLVARELR